MEKEMRIDPALLDTAVQLWKAQAKQHWIPITGNSMMPLMRAGDHVLVAHECSPLRRGDVIVVWQANQLVVHRVIRIERTPDTLRLLTKGDNRPSFDPKVSVDQVVGKVLAIRRGKREISLDTRGWRVFGYGIVYATIGLSGLLGIGQWLKQRLIGPQPNRWTRRLHRAIWKIPVHLIRGWVTWIDRRTR